MASKKRLLLNTGLYLIVSITDVKQFGIYYRRVKKALEAGIKILQLRCKNIGDSAFLKFAKRFKKLAHEHKALLIINDRVDIAYSCGADGVHLGQDDLPLIFAKRVLGKAAIIGKSTHSFSQALKAQSEMADYIGFGPIFKTKTKPELKAIGLKAIRPLVRKIKIPFFVLGGINQDNIKELTSRGAKRVAISDAILSRKDGRRVINNIKKFLS